jgi:D-alanyl-D-alanine carboxypeptidase (penicillin-binding protein 5/6)
MKEFRYNNITQPNRNRLSVDGFLGRRGQDRPYRSRRLLPGFLVTAREASPAFGSPRNQVQIAVRASESLKLLNWGFQSYDAVTLFAKDTAGRHACASGRAPSPIGQGWLWAMTCRSPCRRGYADKIKSEFSRRRCACWRRSRPGRSWAR